MLHPVKKLEVLVIETKRDFTIGAAKNKDVDQPVHKCSRYALLFYIA